jgi:hypothetical protein
MAKTPFKPAKNPNRLAVDLRLFPEERRQTSSLDNYLAAIVKAAPVAAIRGAIAASFTKHY